MSEMDGFEATRKIREGEASSDQLNIVALTANAMKGDREACLEAGMDEHIAKPVRRNDLTDLLARRFGGAKGVALVH
jgi:CheY-like chemotaxis protein